MTVYPFVHSFLVVVCSFRFCCLLAGLHKCCWLDLPEKITSWVLVQLRLLKFRESTRSLDTKILSGFSHLLIITCLGRDMLSLVYLCSCLHLLSYIRIWLIPHSGIKSKQI